MLYLLLLPSDLPMIKGPLFARLLSTYRRLPPRFVTLSMSLPQRLFTGGVIIGFWYRSCSLWQQFSCLHFEDLAYGFESWRQRQDFRPHPLRDVVATNAESWL